MEKATIKAVFILIIIFISISIIPMWVIKDKTKEIGITGRIVRTGGMLTFSIVPRATEFDGNTTDLTNLSSEELQNITDLTLENTNAGMIKFTESIDLTGALDLNSLIEVSYNRIFIDSTLAPNLNKSATLQLYDLTFTNPRILRDGQPCPATICTIESYSGGVLIFNVTQFTVYSVEETSVAAVPSDEARKIRPIPEEKKPPIIEKPVKIKPLFDIKINVINKFKQVVQGGDVIAEIELIKMAGKERVDVDVYYSIKDINNNSIAEKHEIIAVETKTIFVGILSVPFTLAPGDYEFYVRAVLEEDFLESSDSFKVIKRPYIEIAITKSASLLVISIILSVFILILYYEYKRTKRLTKLLKKITEKDLIKAKYTKKKRR